MCHLFVMGPNLWLLYSPRSIVTIIGHLFLGAKRSLLGQTCILCLSRKLVLRSFPKALQQMLHSSTHLFPSPRRTRSKGDETPPGLSQWRQRYNSEAYSSTLTIIRRPQHNSTPTRGVGVSRTNRLVLLILKDLGSKNHPGNP